ncbi:MAG: Bifunctional oligoribonuclease and PAP phosphatase NrnA [Verrucomicrobia subdivision 3 bacterium]|nr:Bifunctional oligoribonuclease and PAP phosphatase NrnA [Limisphaerales bacterium]MCS1412959.1 Bifunctional oligoribonuclease and PAP phosphatase NrnA [Limisphaerales bacterium]
MKTAPKIITRIIEAIRSHKVFCVIGHQRPDGDCVGSQIALALALRNEGYQVTCWNQDTIPQKLVFLDTQKVFTHPEWAQSFDCVIAVDSASLDRTGEVEQFIQDRKVLINIDHHASNTRYADINWVAPSVPSSGELIYRLLKAARWVIKPDIADCLFTAISTDTGSFQYPTTRPSTYEIAGDLVDKGANLAVICDEVYQSYPLSRVKLLKHVYNHFKLTNDNEIAYFWLRPADYQRTGATREDTEGLIDHIRDIAPVIVACLFEELETEVIRLSLRSKSPNINVNDIAKQFGGGGHKAAAGARIKGRPMTIQRRVVKAIRAELAAGKQADLDKPND